MVTFVCIWPIRLTLFLESLAALAEAGLQNGQFFQPLLPGLLQKTSALKVQTSKKPNECYSYYLFMLLCPKHSALHCLGQNRFSTDPDFRKLLSVRGA